jgi:hypothetical protein
VEGRERELESFFSKKQQGKKQRLPVIIAPRARPLSFVHG